MINWKQLPFLRILLPFIIGILLALHFDWHILGLAYFLGFYLFVLVALSIRPIFNTRFSFGYLSQFFLLLLGYQITYQFHAERCTDYLIQSTEPVHYFTGVVDDIPTQKKWLRLIIELENGGNHLDSLQRGCGKILAYIEPDSTNVPLTYGDKILFKGNPQRIATAKNPAAFDTRDFYFKENIHHQIFIKKNKWQLIAHQQGNVFYATVLSWRMRFVEILREHLPISSDFSVASALILGYKNEMDHEVRSAYAATGATHVLAVSGLHVGLVVWLLLLLLNRIKSYHPAWRYIKSAILIILVGLFVVLTGAPPSVRRAALLFSFVLVGKDFARQMSSFNLLAVSAYILLFFHPYLLLDVGFQLSYLAMGGILYFQPRIYELLFFKANWVDKIWQLLSVSIAAQLMTLPISIYYFHQIPLYFWLSSLIVIPAAGLILGLGFLLFFTASISTTIASFVGTLLGGIISSVNEFIFLLELIHFHLIEGLWWSGTVVALVYCVIFAFTVAMNKKEASFQWLQIGLVAVVLISIDFAYRQFEIHQQHKIIIYHTPRHSLIDCIQQRTTFSLQSDSLEQKTLAFNVNNHRAKAQIQQVKPVALSVNNSFTQDVFHYQSNLLQFYNQQIIIVDRSLTQEIEKKSKTNYVLIRHSPQIKMQELIQHFDFQQIIFDTSNKFWQVERWKKECIELNLNCYDVNEKGAWIKEIEF